MELKPKRVTPLTVLPDIADAVRRYEALGFERVPGNAPPGLVGFLAGKTGVMVATTAFMALELGKDLAARLEGQTVTYVYVESVDQSFTALPIGAKVLNDIVLGNTRELLVEDDAGFLILAETIATGL